MASRPGTHGSSTSADSGRVLAVKSSLSGIGWKRHYDELRNFINIVHTTTFHAYSLLRYIFLKEQHNPHFQLEEFIDEEFFRQVWLSLKTIQLRAFIGNYLGDYLKIARYQLPVLAYADQS
ncbi:hypothetical protein BDF22DRAFT_634998, partial [Syncephalis plumigaleata]